MISELFEPTNITYSYKEGFFYVLNIVLVALIIALISMLISLIIGIRKKDCIAILTGTIMVKTIMIFLYQILSNLLSFKNGYTVILFFIASIIIEGFIYEKILKYKKYSGLTVALICNSSILIILYFALIFTLLDNLF